MESSQDLANDYRRSACDHLLQIAATEADSENDDLLEPVEEEPEPLPPSFSKRRAFFIRSLALLCACSLSVGSHYASNILGPLKSRLHRELGTSHTEFGLLLSSFSLNSTWTPLVGGLVASRLGTTFTSILATGVILMGQIFLLCGDIWGDIRLMALGLFIFGLGVSPLAVVQETIIVRFFKSHGLGLSMAFGLIAGKGASFLSARTSYPLTEHWGPRAPFYVATFLAALSVVINLLYISLSKWLIDGSGAELEAPDISEEAKRRLSINMTQAQALQKVADKKKVHLGQIMELGDLFWVYMLLNIFCGMIWSPFIHLAANIIESRYHMPEENAANTASYLLAGPIILYPMAGFFIDHRKHGPIILQLLFLSSILTMSAYLWFVLNPNWTKTPVLGIISFAIGHGFSPLLLVVLVPKIVASKYISTALGAHKSMEQTGSTIFQTLAGIWLDSGSEKRLGDSLMQELLNSFLALNALEFCVLLLLAYLQHWKNSKIHGEQSHIRSNSFNHRSRLDTSSHRGQLYTPTQDTPLLDSSSHFRQYTSDSNLSVLSLRHDMRKDESEIRRGLLMAFLCAALLLAAWALFLVTAWYKLGRKKGTD
ncbi:major facilitator superfamily domain-containing protein [Gymnopilus junonius]|uniref:Lysosomal dipeptide transporter MFSD1 n=1 Tax=Gymnopilus junonius TaxID=109634 RepID=A0A9P5NAJ1_GYMJU|nr:major facilitator superfamily domain-containing protein [Gymnopilus junonius]